MIQGKRIQIILAVAGLSICSIAIAQSDPEAPSNVELVETVPVSVAEESDDTPESAAPAGKSRLMEEIVVTAQKREQNLQDVPISISAFSAETLDARGIGDPKDLPLATPGLVISQATGFSLTYLRGIGTDAFLLADPSVATYIDGVYFPQSSGAAQNFGTIERVEVLKGPQGTLFGRNAVGGAISITTASPSFTEPQTSLFASYSRFDKLETRVQANVPLTDNFAISLSAQYNSENNYLDGTVAGQPLPQEVSKGARIKLRWAPAEWLDLMLAGFKLEQSGVASAFSLNRDPSLAGRLAGIQPQTGYSGANDSPSYFTVDNNVVYGAATINADSFDVKLLGSHQDIVTGTLYDYDGSSAPLAYFSVPNTFLKSKSAELQVLSNKDSWAADQLTWIGGLYYFNSEGGLDPARLGLAAPALTALNQAAAGIPALADALERLNVMLPNAGGGIIDVSGRLGTDSRSAFAQIDWTLADWVGITLGGRYQEEERTVLKSQGAVVLPVGDPLVYISSPRLSDTTRTFKPKLSINFHPWDGGLIYASYQEATKSSTYNIINFLPVDLSNKLLPQKVEPEEMTAYEVGIKTDLFDGNTRLSAAAFYYDIKNIQVQFISLYAGGAVTFENAKAARVRGIDFDIVSQLFPSWIDNLVFTAGVAFLDSEYTDFRSGQGYDEETGLYGANMDFTGNQLARAPKFSGNVGLSKTFDIPGGPLEIGTDYYYSSRYYYLAQENPHFSQDAYGVLGARISYLYERWNLRATIFGKNILDEFYSYGVLPTDFGAQDSPAPPRILGLRLNWDF